MKVEIIAVGTELLLGPVVDTNSTWIGEQLARHGVDMFRRVVVGDNCDRIVETMSEALARSDAVIVTGGLGPTDDDITRDAAAIVMGEKLMFDEQLADDLRAKFSRRGRAMAESNLRQAWRPKSARPIDQQSGTAPGLVCPVGEKVMYLVPGVPSEMREMLNSVVLDELSARAGTSGLIASRTLRCWGVSEAFVGELLADRLAEIDNSETPLRIAFLAKGIEGVHVRVTVKTSDAQTAKYLLDEEQARLCELLGNYVYGTDDQTMEEVVGQELSARGLTLGVAESMTGGLIASRVTNVEGVSGWFRGGVVSYASEVKFDVLGVPVGKVVTRECAAEMAAGVCRVLRCDVGLSVTGVAGPAEQEHQPVGTVFCGIAGLDSEPEVIPLTLSGNRLKIRESAAMHLMNALRLRLS